MRRLQRTVEEIGWTRDVPRLAATDRVGAAIEALRGDAHDCVLVMDHGVVAGVFTSHDFLERVASARLDPATVTLGHVMTPSPRTLRPRDCVAFAINWLAIEAFHDVPIVDDAGRVLGVLTMWDVARHLREIFDDIDATPRVRMPMTDTSSVVAMVDLGGNQ